MSNVKKYVVHLTEAEADALANHLADYIEAHTDAGYDPPYNGDLDLLGIAIEPVKRFTIDPLDGPSAAQEVARDLFGTDTTVGIADKGDIIIYCHESMARSVIAALEGYVEVT